MKKPYFQHIQNLVLKNHEFDRAIEGLAHDIILETGEEKKPIKGKSLILKHVRGNLGHFLNDHYYSFFGLACWGSDFFNLDFDNILIPAGYLDSHLYLALNLLPLEVKNRVTVLDKDVLYKVENAFVPCVDREFSFKIKGQSFVPFWRNNFYSYLSSRKISIPQKPRAFIFQHPQKFISQNSHPGRYILNIEELEKFFHNKNIETEVVSLDYWDKRSPLERVKPFLESNIFIGAYGAWMSTLFLAREKSKIFLLQHPDFQENWWKAERNEGGEIEAHSYWSCEYYLTHELNNDFYNIPCEFEPSFNGAPPSFYHHLDKMKKGSPHSCTALESEHVDALSRSANLFADIETISGLINM